MGGLVLFEHELVILITVVVILVVLSFPVIVIIAASSGLADVGVSMHDICTGSKVFHTMGIHEVQVVMCHLQVAYHCSFILPLLAAPGAEGQAASSLQGLGGMDLLQTHNVW